MRFAQNQLVQRIATREEIAVDMDLGLVHRGHAELLPRCLDLRVK